MTPKELVERLQQLPKEVFETAQIRSVRLHEEDEENHWLEKIEYNAKNEDNYQIDAEVRLYTTE